MCGILGIVRPDATHCIPGLLRGLERLRHRGPDGLGTLDIDGVAVFGHTRLAILDLSPAAHQPMGDGAGRYVITYNGEVYNFRDLRRELESLGHRFRSTSDTEVVIEAYAQWGCEAFTRFDGMFALAIWDKAERRLVLARDRFGEKPLYYARYAGAVLFGSELQAILATGWLPAKPPSVVAWSDYLALGYIPGPASAHPDVFKVEPSSHVVFDWGRPGISTRYWDYAQAFRGKRPMRARDAIHDLSDVLRRTVKSRLVSDVAVGAFLSGGLDSSTIVAMMSNALPYELHTFSVSFEPTQYDESPDALRVATRYRTKHHDHRIGLTEGAAIGRSAVGVYDEPFSDTSLAPMVAVAREAAKYVKVALSGDGADEILAGYATYRADQAMAWLSVTPPLLRSVAASAVRRVVREETLKKTTWRFKVRQFAHGLPYPPQAAHAAWRLLHSEPEIVQCLGVANAEEIREHPPFRVFERHYRDVEDLALLDQHLYVDAKTWLVDDVLVKVDRAGMASSLETRVPYLGLEVTQLAASLPVHLKLGVRRGKVALRGVAWPLLPVENMRKAKAGFSAPINAWFGWTDDNEYRRFNRAVREWWIERWSLPRGGAPAVA